MIPSILTVLGPVTDGTLEAADTALAEGSVLVGNASGYAEALDAKTTTQILVGNGTTITSVALSSDVTMTNAGAVTIANDAVTAAKMGTSAAGVIFKGAAANAVTELQLTAGLIPIGTTNDVTTLNLSGTAGDIIVSDGTTGTVVAVTGDVTINGTGVTTIGNDKVTAAKMSSTAGGGHGIIFKGTNTANDIAELNVPVGNIIVGTTNDVTVLDMGATAGNIMVDSGTAPASVAVSGDATLAANGTLTVTDVTVGSDATGDVLYKSSATALARLAIGTGGQRLVVNAGGTLPQWDTGKIVVEDFSGYAAADAVCNNQIDYTDADGSTGVLNYCVTPKGTRFWYAALGAGQTITGPVMGTGLLNIEGDQADNEGYEIGTHYFGADGRPFYIGQDAAFYFKCKVDLDGDTNYDDLVIGFRRAVNPTNLVEPDHNDYHDFAAFCINDATNDPSTIATHTALNDGATTVTDLVDTVDFTTRSLTVAINVSAAGVVTYKHDAASEGTLAADAQAVAFTFDDGDPVIPFVRFLHCAAGARVVGIVKWEVGYGSV